jgi:hypothetical protein
VKRYQTVIVLKEWMKTKAIQKLRRQIVALEEALGYTMCIVVSTKTSL